MADLVTVSIACNDANNGSFAGRAAAFDFEIDSHHVAVTGDDITFAYAPNAIVVGGVSYPCQSRQHWVGNWCWDSVEISLFDAQQLLRRLLEIACFDLDEWTDGGPFAELIAAREARRSA